MKKSLCLSLSGVVPLILFTVIFCGELPVHAASGPRPPCGTAVFPPYPPLEKSPVVRVWDRAELGRDWKPPACTGWTYSGFTTLVVTVARFRHTSGVEGLLRRVGTISERAGIRYWSTTHKRWQTLVINACALSEAAGDRRRKDFPPSEMTEDSRLYFQQEDNLCGKADLPYAHDKCFTRPVGVRYRKRQHRAVLFDAAFQSR